MKKFACLMLSLLLPLSASAQATSARGPLLIVGGGTQPDALVRHFVDLAGGPGGARIAVLPMASSEPLTSGKGKVEQLVAIGAAAFVLNVTHEEASRAGVADRLDGVTGIWFTGGDQARLTAALGGTPLLAALHAARERGAVVAGTSAGAAIMPDSMITGNQVRGDSLAYYGDEFPSIARHTIEIVPGFGFLPGTIVDQHFVRRERHNRLMSAVLERPSLIGVGIDESTAIEVRPNGEWIVRGIGQVLIYDARSAHVTAPDAAPLGVVNVRVHVLPPGGTFDPAEGIATLP